MTKTNWQPGPKWRIAVIGLGKLGLPTAACLAEAGHSVRGCDADVDLLKRLWIREWPTQEPGLAALLDKFYGTDELQFDSLENARVVSDADVIMIIVPTPSTSDRPRFDNSFVLAALEAMAPTLRRRVDAMRANVDEPEARRFVIDIVSTVMPGTCETVFKPFLEKALDATCGSSLWGLVYNPEFIALGSVVENFKHPDLVLIGESDSESGEVVQQMYEKMLGPAWRDAFTVQLAAQFKEARELDYEAACKLLRKLPRPVEYRRMSLTNAEVTKLSLNCALSSKIALANTIGLLCTTIPGADADVVADAVGCDSRIGSKLLKAGFGAGGCCLPRDLRALEDCLSYVAYGDYSSGADCFIVNQAEVSVAVRDWVAARLDQVAKNAKVVLLGLSYKPGTVILDDSQSIALIRELDSLWFNAAKPKGAARPRPSHVHDPQMRAMRGRPPFDGFSLLVEVPLDEILKNAEAVILATPDPVYKALDWAHVDSLVAEGCVIVDVWRIAKDAARAGVFKKAEWIGFGVGPAAKPPTEPA